MHPSLMSFYGDTGSRMVVPEAYTASGHIVPIDSLREARVNSIKDTTLENAVAYLKQLMFLPANGDVAGIATKRL